MISMRRIFNHVDRQTGEAMKMNLLPEQTSQYKFAHIVRQIRSVREIIEVNTARCSFAIASRNLRYRLSAL
jgi:hypothetical protein